MKKISLLLVTLLTSGFVMAKLPTPTPEQAAAADLAKAKTAHGDKVGAYKLCLAQNEVANKYKKSRYSSAWGMHQSRSLCPTSDELIIGKELICS